MTGSANLSAMVAARIALVALAVIAVVSGLLMLLAGEPVRGALVLVSSVGPLWLVRYLARDQAR